MSRKLAQAAACIVLAFSSAGAEAAVLAGASFGKTSYSSSDFKDGKAMKFAVGYELAAVPVFFDLALQKTDDSKIVNTNASINFEAMQLGVGYRLGRPDGTGVFVRVSYFDADLTVTGPFPDQGDGSTGIAFGVGGTWMFVPKVGLRVEWEKFDGVEHSVVEDQDISVLTGGVVIRFGQ